jgi:DNA-binding transcriptional ArsR family regulator
MSTAREKAVADVFFALGDGTRLSVVRKLGAGGALSATALSEGAHVTRQAIVKHLQVLADAGLVTADRHGREQRYRITAGRLYDAVDWITDVGAAWDDRLARLQRRVDERPRAGS